MFDENQTVKVIWKPFSREWYENKGYVFTKYNKPFYAKVKDLSPSSVVKIEVTCDYCGKVYQKPYRDVLISHCVNNIDTCKECKGHKIHESVHSKNAKRTYERLQERCSELGYKLITQYNDTLTLKDKFEYECPLHGKQVVNINNFLNEHKGCNACGNILISKKLTLTPNEVKEIIEKYNDNKCLNAEKYYSTYAHNLIIQCGFCGSTYKTSLSVYKASNNKRCPKCAAKESGGARYVRETLEKNGFVYIQEKKFDDCKDKRALPFDFYLPEFNSCIEFDGEQHYLPKYGYETFELIQKHDKMKNDYCEANGIKLYRISCYDTGYLDEVINKLHSIKQNQIA